MARVGGWQKENSASCEDLKVSPTLSVFVLFSRVTSRKIGRKSEQLGDSINNP